MACSVILTRWCASYLWRSPRMISIASGTDGAFTITGWKRRSRAPSFSMYLRYSSSVVAPIVWISPRESAGLSMFDASMAPSAAPAPISVCSSSRNRTTFSDWRISFITAFSRSSNWPRYFVPATRAPRSSCRSRLFTSTSGTSCETIFCASPSTMAVLPTPGSPMSTGVLRAPRQDLDDALDLLLAPDDGVELALAGELREVARELVEHGRLRALLRARVVLVAEQRQRLLTDLIETGAERLEDLGRDRLALFHETQQQVLGPDVIVTELTRLFDGQFEDALGLRSEGNFTERERLGEPGERALHLGLHGLEAQTQALEDGRRDAFTVTDEAEKNVFGPHEVVSEPPRFFSRQDDYSPRPFGEPFKHWCPPPLFRVSVTADFALGDA